VKQMKIRDFAHALELTIEQWERLVLSDFIDVNRKKDIANSMGYGPIHSSCFLCHYLEFNCAKCLSWSGTSNRDYACTYPNSIYYKWLTIQSAYHGSTSSSTKRKVATEEVVTFLKDQFLQYTKEGHANDPNI